MGNHLRSGMIFDTTPERVPEKTNPYGLRLAREVSSGELPALYGSNLKKVSDNWPKFAAESMGVEGPSPQIVLEIGCHQGVTLVELALAHPNTFFVGMDITYKRVVITAERIRAAGCQNAVVVHGQAQFLAEIFRESELSGAIAFFPDPWSKKKRQIKHRLLSAEFCQMLSSRLVEGGFTWIKTDAKDYFSETTTGMTAAGFESVTRSDNFGAIMSGQHMSTFERRFMAKKIPTFEGRWRKPINHFEAGKNCPK